MKKFLLALLISLFVFVGCGDRGYLKTAYAGYEDLFDSVKGSSWAIYVRTTGGMAATCSAEAVKSDDKETLLLSAGHCFLGESVSKTDFLATQDHKTFYKASLLRSGLVLKRGMQETSTTMNDYDGNDWAVVKVDVKNQPVISIGDSEKLRLGEDIIVVGLPFGLDFLGVQGIVGSKDISLSSYTWNHYYGGNIFIAGGNSGSSVISTKQKAIIGIVCAGPGQQSSMLIFMPIHMLPKNAFEKR